MDRRALIAAFAAYAFAWMKFPGRRAVFMMVVALQVVPLQIALVPILRDYSALHLNGTFLGIWLAHSGFGLALATFLLYNYISGLPREILESAFVDGASHFTAFTQLVLPLSVPALAAFAIFQFLWVWNDLLVALTFARETQPITVAIFTQMRQFSANIELIAPAAFVSLAIPLVVGGVGSAVSPEPGTYLLFLGLYDVVFAILSWASFEYVVTE